MTKHLQHTHTHTHTHLHTQKDILTLVRVTESMSQGMPIFFIVIFLRVGWRSLRLRRLCRCHRRHHRHRCDTWQTIIVLYARQIKRPPPKLLPSLSHFFPPAVSHLDASLCHLGRRSQDRRYRVSSSSSSTMVYSIQWLAVLYQMYPFTLYY